MSRSSFLRPGGQDYQTDQDQDEFYFSARGSGKLIIDVEANIFAAGDAFFVPAGIKHHFENTTSDLATWAIFF